LQNSQVQQHGQVALRLQHNMVLLDPAAADHLFACLGQQARAAQGLASAC
jgi:hypothetical protein